MRLPQIPSPEVHDADYGYSGRYTVVIYNNDYNTMGEVISAIMAATACCFEEAYIETWEAHHFGRANIHFDTQPSCCAVAAMVSRIGVRTEVTPEWEN